MPNCMDPVAPVAAALIDCVIQQLAQCGDPVCRASVVPGSLAAWDNCECQKNGGCGGQAYVLVNTITPMNNDPSNANPACAWEYEAVLTVGIVRCSKALDADGKPPSAQVLNDESTRILRDAALMRQAIICCWPSSVTPNLERADWRLLGYTTVGPDGGCAGGTQQVSFRFSDCRCPG
jgi:hypothetical protein